MDVYCLRCCSGLGDFIRWERSSYLGPTDRSIRRIQQGQWSFLRRRMVPVLGNDVADWHPPIQLGTAAILMNVPAVSLPKIAILMFYLRLNPTRGFRYSTYAVLFITWSYLISFMLVQIFGCSPVDKFWKPLKDGKCINKGPLYLAIPITNMIIDLLILLLPINMLIKLQVGKRTKAVLAAIFAFSSCTVVVSAVRIWATTEVASDPDFTWASAHSNAVLVVELNMTVVCACVMVLRPFCRRHLPFLLGGTGKSGPGNTPGGHGILNYDGPSGPKSKSGYRTKVSGGSSDFKRSDGKRGMWSGLGSGLKEEDDDMESLSTELNTLPPKARREGNVATRDGGGVDPMRLEKWRHPENVQNGSGESMSVGRESLRAGYQNQRGREDDIEGGIVKTVSLDVR